jgi:hypothetical protein
MQILHTKHNMHQPVSMRRYLSLRPSHTELSLRGNEIIQGEKINNLKDENMFEII